ncbi:hypothetical protein D3C87_622320 [compost metagenome]
MKFALCQEYPDAGRIQQGPYLFTTLISCPASDHNGDLQESLYDLVDVTPQRCPGPPSLQLLLQY